MCGRPEKDDFVDSRGYPTVLAVGRDRFGGGTACQCRRNDIATALWRCHGVAYIHVLTLVYSYVEDVRQVSVDTTLPD